MRQPLPPPSATALMVLACAVLPLLSGCPGPKPWQGITPAEFARLNEHRVVGIAHLENGAKTEATAEFAAIRKARPALAFGWTNEAAAQAAPPAQPGAGLEAAKEGVARARTAAWPRVVLGQILESAGRREEAGKELQEAWKLEPDNVRVVGALANHLKNTGGDHAARLYDLRKRLAGLASDNLVAQIDWLEIQADRGEHAGALATLGRIQQLLPRVRPAQQPLLAEARTELENGGKNRAVRGLANTLRSYLIYGRDANVLYGNSQDPARWVMREWDVAPPPLPGPPVAPAEVTWEDVTAEAGLNALSAPGIAPVAIGDWDLSPDAGTGVGAVRAPFQASPDLAVGERVLLNRDGRFGTQTGASAPHPGAPLLADLDNDFALDLYLAGPAGDRIVQNKNGFTPNVNDSGQEKPLWVRKHRARPPFPTPGRGPGVPLALDVDMDGDLDILRPSGSRDQPALRYQRNNGNLTFADLTSSPGLKMPSLGARQVAFGDFDGDDDPDLFLVRSSGPCRLILNRRMDVFRDASDEWGLRPDRGARCATVADFDRDGDWDVVVAGHAPHGTVLYRNTGRRLDVDPSGLPAAGTSGADWVQFLDYDNDGWLDLAFAGKEGLRLLRNDAGRFVDGGPAGAAAPAAWVRAFDYDMDGDLDLLAGSPSGKLRLLRNKGANARPWMRVELEGYLINTQPPEDQQTQANNSYAIGAVLEPRTAWESPKLLVTEPITHVGMGRAARAAALRVTWTHGVPQDLVGPAASQTVHQRQEPKGSCPFLYTWDGEKWRFACDFNWRSPLGMLFARGAPIPHDQTGDWVKIAGESIRPLGPYYHLMATEELREVSYFDQVRFLAVDHPADTEIYLDERFRLGPQPPFRIYTARNHRQVVSARNEAGTDLLPALRATDNVYTPVPPGPYRGVRRPHDLVMDLGPVPDPRNVTLFLRGWIYPAGTSTNVGASQNPEIQVIPPTLSVGDGRGGWTEVDRNVGLPCGKRKTVVLDLSGRFIGNDHRVKLTTTMEIRWDRAFYTSGEAHAPARRTALPMVEADLSERGYGTAYYEAPDGPVLFDFNRPLPPSRAPNWRPIQGAFTKLGDCAPLLRAVDDRYAIVAPGDALHLIFDPAKLPPLPGGWKRDFVLMSDGWTKDSDPNTVTGEMVGPLPFHGMKRYPYGPGERLPDTPAHRAWKKEWNTRVMGSGR